MKIIEREHLRLISVFLILTAVTVVARAQSGITGTYVYKSGNNNNAIKVEEIGEGKIRVAFGGNYEYKASGEWMANSGGTSLITTCLNGNSAVLTMKEYPDCRINLKFGAGKLSVKQEGDSSDCGFGASVYADGNYTKKSGAVPNFEDWSFDEEDSGSVETSGSAQNSRTERIRFAKGKSSAILSGRIIKGQEIVYLIGARAGQTLEINVADGGANNDVVFSLIAPDGKNLTGEVENGDGYDSAWKGKLTKIGDYKIEVGTIESQKTNFKISVSIR